MFKLLATKVSTSENIQIGPKVSTLFSSTALTLLWHGTNEYSALLGIVVHPKRFTIMWWGGVSPQPPPVCSIHLDDVMSATGQRCQCAHHTPATGGEERES